MYKYGDINKFFLVFVNIVLRRDSSEVNRIILVRFFRYFFF